MITALCFGTGRFLRSVLVPLLQRNDEKGGVRAAGAPALIQTRGTSFVEHMQQAQQHEASFEVDTVFPNGAVTTDRFACHGAFSMKDAASKKAVHEVLVPLFLQSCCSNNNNDDNIILGVGVTEAGLASEPTMRDLYGLLCALLAAQHEHEHDDDDADDDDGSMQQGKKICLINTDNVPHNGDVLKQHMLALNAAAAAAADKNDNDTTNKNQQAAFDPSRVAFLNTMVDRITSHRANDPLVPRAEGPVPAKALVVLDPHGDLPAWFTSQQAQQSSQNLGLVVRTSKQQLETDICLKLRVANGTHTALAHALAVSGVCNTDQLMANHGGNNNNSLWLDYVDALVHDQIVPATATITKQQQDDEAVLAVWEDWRRRLVHPHFGLNTFFIAQNGPAKGGLRLGPTVVDLVQNNNNNKAVVDAQQQQSGITVTMAFAWAALLRWLTPAAVAERHDPNGVIYTGWLQGAASRVQTGSSGSGNDDDDDDTVMYADGLRYNLKQGWYEFRCACEVIVGDSTTMKPVSEWLAAVGPQHQQQPAACLPAIRAYLTAESGGNLAVVSSQPQLDVLARAIATLYARMVAGDDLLALLQEMKDGQGSFSAGMQTDCCALLER